jgi:hypothetical protein
VCKPPTEVYRHPSKGARPGGRAWTRCPHRVAQHRMCYEKSGDVSGGNKRPGSMPYDPDQHDRRSIHLTQWEYRRPAAYLPAVSRLRLVLLPRAPLSPRVPIRSGGRRAHGVERLRTHRSRGMAPVAIPPARNRNGRVHRDAKSTMRRCMKRSGINHMHGVIGITADPDGDDANRGGDTSPGASDIHRPCRRPPS